MADTIITTAPTQRDDSGAGWAVAFVVILAVVLVGGFFVYRYRYAGAAAVPASAASINVTIPTAVPTTGGTPAAPAPQGGSNY